MQETERLVRRSAFFNHRQLALLGHALRNPAALYSFRSHALSHNVVRQTARIDLLFLVKKGLLEPRKAGRQLLFHPARDLERRLRSLR